MRPRVSICLPNLNNRRFLDERLECLFEQSFRDWELIVSDNYSDDGAWEFFQARARQEPRMRIFQAPRQGLYPNWNRCIEAATGEFVYVATSDDTLAPDALQKLVAALDAHPDCGLAHCPLRTIDEHGHAGPQWWPTHSTFARSSGPLLEVPHVRRAPFDGLLHLLGSSVYISITQVLIRRSLFDRIGLFPVGWGSVGDFNWQMRAGLAADTVHVPDTWATWRVHGDQATAGAGLQSPAHAGKVEEMIDDALRGTWDFLSREIRASIDSPWRDRWREFRAFVREMRRRESLADRRAHMLVQLLRGSWPARREFRAKLFRTAPLELSAPAIVKEWVEQATGRPALEVLAEAKT